jgi:hypothetical protein
MTSSNQKYGQHDEMPDLDAPLPEYIEELLEKGKTQRTRILPGAEGPEISKKPYALTHVEVDFTDETNLRRCIALLKWSDERLQRLPDLLAMWNWVETVRDGMTLRFGTRWYKQAFFEERKNAFLERDHLSYFAMFGAKAEDLKTWHEVLG